jgi:hypothetical protein
MKTIINVFKKTSLTTLFFILISNIPVLAQDDAGNIYLKAMEDELNRNIKDLHLEGVKNPFFISYLIVNGQKLSVQSTLGSIVLSQSKPYSTDDVQVLVGDYKTNNKNFVPSMYSWDNYGYPEFPVKPDYYCIRRELWQQTDWCFKTAGERLVKKMSAMNQQVLDPVDTIAGDFTRAQSNKLKIENKENLTDKAEWEKIISKLSITFMDYPDILTSGVSFNSLISSAYLTNSEGSSAMYPLNISVIKVTASTITDDGEKLSDEMSFVSAQSEKLKNIDEMVKNIKIMADNLVALKKAPKLEADYSGPVLFESDANASLFLKKFFLDKTGMYSNRIPICLDNDTKTYYSSQLKSLEVKLNRKVLPNSITVTLKPTLETFENRELIGNYQIDAEGIIPKDNLILVKDGILVNLMNDRVPSLNLGESNGNSRISLSSYGMNIEKSPGVIQIADKEAISLKDIKNKLIQAAQKEGLEYALIIRKTTAYKSDNDFMFFGSDSKKPILSLVKVYKVSVKTGEETLIRGCELPDVGLSSFKHIIASSNTNYIFNTMASSGENYNSPGGLSGVPVSIILPQAVLFEEVEISKKNLSGSKKPPLVLNPIIKR